MNDLQIKCKLQNFYKDFIKNIDDVSIRQHVINHSFITGGAIASMLLNEEPNDFDIYFDDVDICKEVVTYFLEKANKKINKDYYFHEYLDEENKIGKFEDRVKIYIPHIGSFKLKAANDLYYPIFVTSNAITLNNNVQIIIRFVGSPTEVHKNYDFEHTKCCYQPSTNKLILPKESLKSILTKELTYVGSKYPLASIIRTRKFIKRGWNINAGQYLKMVFQLQELNLKDPKVLSDQLTGVDLILFKHLIDEIEKQEIITNSWLINKIDEVFSGEDLTVDWTKFISSI